MAIARTRYPSQLERVYFRQIKKLLDANKKKIRQAFMTEIRPRIHHYRGMIDRMRINSLRVNDSLDEIDSILERLRNTAENQLFSIPVIERISRQFVTQINQHARANFRQQITRVLGIDPTANEPWLSSFLETAIQENVSFIKSIATQYHDRIESIIIQGVRRGESITDIASRITEVADVSVGRARFIARDQLGSIHGDIVKRRQSNVGLSRFTWRTSGDERVRDSHEQLDNKVFTWAEGAINERGERIWPGTDYNCRCTAQIVEEDLLELAEVD